MPYLRIHVCLEKSPDTASQAVPSGNFTSYCQAFEQQVKVKHGKWYRKHHAKPTKKNEGGLHGQACEWRGKLKGSICHATSGLTYIRNFCKHYSVNTTLATETPRPPALLHCKS